ncbi:MAG: type II toxin-antitoxin system PemK/MazF family toxin [Acidimicrobiia bacterium]|nr:type II toxin-antitoxin system PemK/MazF family toxin [Acidimicrobiia bacterium]MYL09163.1 type II toxin-antitoxin system PemK/MazF family toxin [Acidimicrobiia bacterium]
MLMMRLCSMRRQAMLLMQAGDIVRCDFGTPARGEPGLIRPAIIITSDDVLEFRQHAIVVVPCTTTKRGWLSEVAIEGFGVAQAHLPTTISVDRVVESTGTNVGFVALQQIRELIADLLGL